MNKLLLQLSLGLSLLIVGNVSAMPVSTTNEVQTETVGNARFTIITPSLIRMEWSQTKSFEDRPSLTFIHRKMPSVKYSRIKKGNEIIIETSELSLKYRENGRPFDAGNLKVNFRLGASRKTWKPGLSDNMNLKGTMRTVDQCEGVEPKMLENGILSRDGWAIIDDSKSMVFEDSNGKQWIAQRQDTTATDLYLFAYGHRYKEALSDYTKIAGKAPLPPKYAFGYWYSRYFCYSDAEIKGLVREMEQYDVPLDVFIIDMDWHNTYGISANQGNMIGWTGYTWNKTLFPNPQKSLEWLHQRDLKVSLNLHPADGIYHQEECFPRMAQKLQIDTTGLDRIAYYLENEKWADAYFSEVIHPLEKDGVDFWWLDWQQSINSQEFPHLNHTWWLNHNFFTDMEVNRKERPLLFHRWGGMGNHRYPLGFSGDSHATFEMLSTLPYFTSTASNVGFGYWSHDIGGHMQTTPSTDPDLYLRWIQFGVFSPILRTHSSKQGNIERRIWKFPNFQQMNEALHLRYALVPYIYTAARESYDTGISLCRPMYYEFPEASMAYEVPKQYMFGEDLLVCPVTTPLDTNGLASQTTWLPQGLWFDMSKGTLLEGNQNYSDQYTAGEIPYFARAGAIIPMNPKVNNLQKDPNHLVLAIIPGAKGKGTLYEDQGNDQEYKNGIYATTVFEQTRDEKSIEVNIHPRKGNFPEMSDRRKYTLRFLSSLPAEKVIVNGTEYPYSSTSQEGSWSFDGQSLEIMIHTPALETNKSIHIIVQTETKESLELTQGMKGLFTRLAPAMMEIKMDISQKDWARSPSDQLLWLSQVPSLIEEHPSQAKDLLHNYKEKLVRQLDELVSNYGVEAAHANRFKKILLNK